MRLLLLFLSHRALFSLRGLSRTSLQKSRLQRLGESKQQLLQEDVGERNPISGGYDFNYWKKAFVSQPTEFEYTLNEDEIDGQVPASFSGTLYRMMPALFERGGKEYAHYLDGDGYCVSVSFGPGGKVKFTSRFVQTQEFQEETKADKVLFRSTFRTQRPSKLVADTLCLNNGFDLKLKNLANTNVMAWGGKLFALYEAGVPIELDPHTLATVGEYDMELGDALRSGISVVVPELLSAFPGLHARLFGASMTAHPKIDAARGRLVSWTWQAEVSPERGPLDTRPVLSFYEWDKDLKHDGPVHHRLDSSTVAPHDFSLTRDYYCLVENRLSGNVLPYLLGKTCPAETVAIEPGSDMILNLVPRPSGKKAGTPALRISLDTPGFAIHSACAFQQDDDDNRLTLLTTGWLTETVKEGKVKGGLLGSWEGTAPKFDVIPVTLLYRSVIDIKTATLLSHAPVPGLETTIIEHPHANPLFEGRPVRYLYMSVGSQTGISSPPLGYMRVDLASGDKQVWMAPIHTYCEEVVLVPMEGLSAETDVWILVTMLDAVKNKTCVAILDGRDVAKGPVCRIWLRHHLPHSLHGCFDAKKVM